MRMRYIQNQYVINLKTFISIQFKQVNIENQFEYYYS